MAKIFGNIGSFSELISEMDGMYKPSSLDEITAFKNNFSNIAIQTKEKVNKEILDEIDNLKNKLKELSSKYDNDLKHRQDLLIKEKNDIDSKINIYSTKSSNVFIKLYYWFKLNNLLKRKEYLKNHFDEEKKKTLINLEKDILSIQKDLDYKEKNIEKLVEETTKSRVEIFKTINSLLLKNNKLYEGALGEQMVLDELKKLPDSFSVINDFRKKFPEGIYRKETNDLIYSVQIDHIVVGPSGIFIIETKNWSQRSINDKNLFSPVKQIKRAQNAIYYYLNNLIKDGKLSSFVHQWGLLEISPISIVVSIQQPPNQKFQYVTILSLQNLLKYINNRKKIFSESQINELTDILSTKNIYNEDKKGYSKAYYRGRRKKENNRKHYTDNYYYDYDDDIDDMTDGDDDDDDDDDDIDDMIGGDDYDDIDDMI